MNKLGVQSPLELLRFTFSLNHANILPVVAAGAADGEAIRGISRGTAALEAPGFGERTPTAVA